METMTYTAPTAGLYVCGACGTRFAGYSDHDTEGCAGADVETFEHLLHLEQAVRVSSAVSAFRGAGVSNFRAGQQDTAVQADKARLAKAIDALTPEQGRAFGAYRAVATAAAN